MSIGPISMLHPEELIDLEARGALDERGRARLDAHSARCAACRYERTMRVQFAEVLREHDAERGLHADEGALRDRSSTWRRIWLWVAVAVTLVAGAHLLPPSPEGPATSPVARVAATERTELVPHDRALDARPVVTRAPAPAAPPVPTAAMLFERANRARVAGDYDAALVAYRRLEQRYPSSLEARVSVVAMGRMQLDRGDGAGALASFDRYRAWGNGDVDAVVMAGRALALDELGADTSALAWADLLASHPETPYAEHARLRMAARSM